MYVFLRLCYISGRGKRRKGGGFLKQGRGNRAVVIKSGRRARALLNVQTVLFCDRRRGQETGDRKGIADRRGVHLEAGVGNGGCWALLGGYQG